MSTIEEISDHTPYIGKAVGIDFTSRFEDYVGFLDQVFRPDAPAGYFRSILAKLYSHHDEVRDNSWIVSDPAGFRAAVGSFPFTSEVCGQTLRGRIIGNVAVHPDDRSKGYMKALMNLAMDDACAEGIDYMVLGGQRQRYQYFSFDSAGSNYTFAVTKTNLRHRYGSGRQPAVSLKPLMPGDDASLKKIEGLYTAGSFHTIRPAPHFYEILTTWVSKPYVAYRGDEFAGYVVFSQDLSVVVEFMAASPELLQELILAAVDLSSKGELSFVLPPFETESIRLLADICESCSISSDSKFTVLNYRSVIEAFLHLKASYTALSDGIFTIGIDGRASYESLRITVAQGRIKVEPIESASYEPDISLSHLEAMNLLFAPISPLRNLQRIPPHATQWLPLPLYICNLDNA
ncbi:MAG: GNAT family N-acetyltransferase [Saccharofermentanales bacterium]